jgi:hypothetical protein
MEEEDVVEFEASNTCETVDIAGEMDSTNGNCRLLAALVCTQVNKKNTGEQKEHVATTRDTFSIC